MLTNFIITLYRILWFLQVSILYMSALQHQQRLPKYKLIYTRTWKTLGKNFVGFFSNLENIVKWKVSQKICNYIKSPSINIPIIYKCIKILYLFVHSYKIMYIYNYAVTMTVYICIYTSYIYIYAGVQDVEIFLGPTGLDHRVIFTYVSSTAGGISGMYTN